MAPRTSSHRRLLLPLILAVMLVGEAAGLAVAGRTPSEESTRSSAVATQLSRTQTRVSQPEAKPTIAAEAALAQTHLRPTLDRAATIRPGIAATARATTVLVSNRSTKPAAATYRGRNHVWIPALGIDRSIASFPCSRSQAPGNHVYRWGCAGKNNVYLMGHAYGVFKPLHDAYVNGRLRKGMKVVYADANGHVRTYSVAWWKVTKPTTSASWAWAAQSRPSMTLQTCVGANGQLRLMVRLVATG